MAIAIKPPEQPTKPGYYWILELSYNGEQTWSIVEASTYTRGRDTLVYWAPGDEVERLWEELSPIDIRGPIPPPRRKKVRHAQSS